MVLFTGLIWLTYSNVCLFWLSAKISFLLFIPRVGVKWLHISCLLLSSRFFFFFSSDVTVCSCSASVDRRVVTLGP